jgi:hypothetical protein
MNINQPSFLQPMAIPFKVEQFLLRRQVQLEKEVRNSPLYRKLDAFAGPEQMRTAIRDYIVPGCLLPEGFSPVLDEALLTVRTVARLPYEVQVNMATDAEFSSRTIALLENNKLLFSIPCCLLRWCSSAELVYHLAAATFYAIREVPRHIAWLLDRRVVFGLEEREQGMELIRLMTYAADCFALMCCGNVETVLNEGFCRATGLNPKGQGVDFNRLAEHSLKSGDFGVAQLLNEGKWAVPYSPLRPLILAEFVKTELYRSCRGEPGGIPWAEFEAAVLEMEAIAHPPMKELPEAQVRFTCIAGLLAGRFILEAEGVVAKAREESFREFFQLEPAEWNDIVEKLGWRLGKDSNTRELLEQLLTGADAKWANIHAVRIFRVALTLAVCEYGSGIPEKVLGALGSMGIWLQLSRSEWIAIHETLLEECKEQEKDEQA